jgi:hypothetical protein
MSWKQTKQAMVSDLEKCVSDHTGTAVALKVWSIWKHSLDALKEFAR